MPPEPRTPVDLHLCWLLRSPQVGNSGRCRPPLLALAVAVLVLGLDAGLTAIALAGLLICGVLTYVGVLDEMGTITWAGEGVGGIGVPLLAAVLLCYIGALVSAFASSVGITAL